MATAIGRSYELARSVGATIPEAIFLAAISIPESGGNDGAVNPSSGACGRWQIHPPIPDCHNPKKNARVALHKLRTQGRGAWTATLVRGDVRKARAVSRHEVRGPTMKGGRARPVGINAAGLTLVLHPGNDAGHQDHGHLEFRTRAQARAFGRKLEKRGWIVREHIDFGGVAGSCNCDPHCGKAHCDNRALDINWPDKGSEKGRLISLGNQLERGGTYVGGVPGRSGRTLPQGAGGGADGAVVPVGFWDEVKEDAIRGGADVIPGLGPLNRAFSALTEGKGGLETIAGAIAFFLNPDNWRRAFQMALGVLVMGLAFIFIAIDLIRENTPDDVKTGLEALAIWKGGELAGSVASGTLRRGGSRELKREAKYRRADREEKRARATEESTGRGAESLLDWNKEAVIGAPGVEGFERRRIRQEAKGRGRKATTAAKRAAARPSRDMFVGNRGPTD